MNLFRTFIHIKVLEIDFALSDSDGRTVFIIIRLIYIDISIVENAHSVAISFVKLNEAKRVIFNFIEHVEYLFNRLVHIINVLLIRGIDNNIRIIIIKVVIIIAKGGFLDNTNNNLGIETDGLVILGSVKQY